MHHVALDRTRPDDRHLNDNIIETFRLHPRQRCHLRAALDLKHADRIGLLHYLKGGRVIFRNMRKIERSPALATKLKGILRSEERRVGKSVELSDVSIVGQENRA